MLAFEALHRIHAATSEGAAHRPAPGTLDTALAVPAGAGERVPLPEPAPLDTPVRRALRERRSSFGRFTAAEPLDPARLSTALAAAVAAGTLDSDTESRDSAPVTRLCVFVNDVRGVPAGLYE